MVEILGSSSVFDGLQFPAKEVKDFENQLNEIQTKLHADRDPHEGKTAEEVYAERLRVITLCDSMVQEPDMVVKALLARCQLWVEIVEEKYGDGV